MLVEVCVDSVDSAVAAQEGGAARVELCSALLEGGLTPSAGVTEVARSRLHIGLHVMIRPRGGDFCYTDTEIACMARDIEAAKRHGADGIVLGVLTPDGDVDDARAAELMALARPLSLTFHRAFDMTRDPAASLERLVELGVDRVLTSGQEGSALEGLDLLATLVRQAGDRIVVMPGGGIHARNLPRILRESGAREVHVTGPAVVESRMRYRNARCFMGGELRPSEFAITVTDRERVAELVRLSKQPA